MLQNFKNFIELLKLPPAILSTISLATGLILFLPDSIIKYKREIWINNWNFFLIIYNYANCSVNKLLLSKN